MSEKPSYLKRQIRELKQKKRRVASSRNRRAQMKNQTVATTLREFEE